jgi:hypothetical protein
MDLFNPDASVQVMQLEGGRICLVIDDALLAPERVVEYALAQRDAFQAIDFSKYPGNYIDAPPALAEAFLDCFLQRARPRFDARRCRFAHIRLSMVTQPVAALRPRQWLCHIDDFLLPPTESMPASVLYLFRDELLGGTGFYVRDRPAAEVDAMLELADTLPADAFMQRTGLAPSYLHASNPYFRRIGGVAAKWNRLIFYDGGMLHSAEIAHPERLNGDPAAGRLTLNGFFTCRRNLA